MKITQLRSATLVIEVGAHKILLDPMLSPRHGLPPLRLLDGVRERNPTKELPSNAQEVLQGVTHCLITHCQKGHFDHLDRAGKAWLRERQIPVICTPRDASYLAQRGLNVQPLAQQHDLPQPFLGGTIRTLRATHGKGAIKLLMEHGVGYLLALPGEPSLFIAGDTVLTPALQAFVQLHKPAISIVPAGGAHFDVGQELIMDAADVLTFCQWVDGVVIANHLEALSHCPVSRDEVRRVTSAGGVQQRLLIPDDGQCLEFFDHLRADALETFDTANACIA